MFPAGRETTRLSSHPHLGTECKTPLDSLGNCSERQIFCLIESLQVQLSSILQVSIMLMVQICMKSVKIKMQRNNGCFKELVTLGKASWLPRTGKMATSGENLCLNSRVTFAMVSRMGPKWGSGSDTCGPMSLMHKTIYNINI